MSKEQVERITKVKCKKGEWTIAYQQKNEGTQTYDSYEIVSKDMPLEQLPKRLQVMANHVEEICELPRGAAKKIVVSGISVTHTDSNVYLVITAVRALSRSKTPMLINTPARPAYADNDQDDMYCMSDECYKDMLAVMNEAMKYVRGERAQQKLDFDNTNGTPDNAGRADDNEDEEEPPKKKSRERKSSGYQGFTRAAKAPITKMW